MKDYLLSLLFGVIEGLTEFLPVSSTAHLRIAQAATGVNLEDNYWKMYAIVIQLGAILSVLVYFRRRIVQFVKSFPEGQRGDRNVATHPVTLTLLAFVVTAIPALVLKQAGVIDENLENLWVIGGSLLIGGVIMWVVDATSVSPRTLDMDRMTLAQSIWIGAAQVLSAVFPGVSRSMSTIAAGQVGGMSREAALEFSFFLSIPTMIAATGKELSDTLRGDGINGPLSLSAHQWGVLIVGFVISFVVAWAVIAWFMAWVRRRGFVPFALYRIALGIAVIIWAATSRA